ncbi:flagellar hook-basal body complex protein [Pseudodesulfovibrio thermohalotolerans]|uniref:flagellar hook protein FlgE n=1 Tax=Pseudodesulfovibrio thermohalotolerans TaxID=2880651 RepID=UPI0022B9DE52|nr:flagellar hook-basal body complex protein [Pseudodesulfovibrio thermohalotolerans]WFS62547.1 flagellar hook-basal body complex protein [Pseudodesulfovibrio thermohalotolerans]
MSFGSMYVGATGVVAHSEGMQVLANNLANVDTIGYKRSDILFGDLISQQVASGGALYESGSVRTSQLGKGVGVSSIRGDFTSGALSGTTSATDLAISGEGFFGVNDPSGTIRGASHYTRAGDFRFDNEAYLVNAQGYRLQGFAYDRETGEWSGSVSDIQLPYEDVTVDGQTARVVQSSPLATSSVEVVTRLDHSALSQISDENNPFFAMLGAYAANGTDSDSPFGDAQPQYSTAVDVFDENGVNHEMTIYFDPVSTAGLSNAVPGYTYWEYLVALPGESDGSTANGTSAAGLAGMGVLTFNDRGALINQSAFTLDLANASGAGGTSLGAWVPAEFSEDGLAQFNYTFASNGGAGTIAYDFGVNSDTASWAGGSVASAADIGTNANLLPEMDSMNRDARVTTSYDLPSSTLFSLQDGYSWGYLNYVSVNEEGVLSGHFSNGQTEEMYQVAVYKFNSPWGLKRDGGTNFVATEASGEAILGTAGDRGRGLINQNTLEESNVDMAREFSNMIVTQRGYQANTKVITTSDSILNTLISIKR